MENLDYKTIKKIFQRAIELPVEDRRKFLEKACGNSVEVMNKVKTLLKAADSEFLEKPFAQGFPKEKLTNRPADSVEIPGEIQNADAFKNYKIISKVGHGGMGEVFLARDKRLDRRVALKLLPKDVTNDQERLRRFKQEARAISSLNHPNILTIYEFRMNDDGNYFIASEFVEGESLDEMFYHESFGVSKAINIGVQVASALESSHEAGIIHRDIKPANIMLRPDGIIKVLDFGLAKLTEDFVASRGDSVESTRTVFQTQSRTIMGTAPYMSPEQIRGKNIDHRTDLWSLGIVLYEMLCGQKPFFGETEADTVAAILSGEPIPLPSDAEDLSPKLAQVISKLLKKDVGRRYGNAQEVKLDLQKIQAQIEASNNSDLKLSVGGDGSSVEIESPTTDPNTIPASDEYGETTDRAEAYATKSFFSRNLNYFSRVLGLIVAGGVITLFAVWFYAENLVSNDSNPPAVKTSEVASWSAAPNELYSRAAFSPDAKMIAFGSTKSGRLSIWVKQNNSGEPIRITKDDFYNRYPVWSPDGSELAYFSLRGEKKGFWRVPSFGGIPKLIGNITQGAAIPLDWTKSGKIYYMDGFNLFSMEIDSGRVEAITKFPRNDRSVRMIRVSPDESTLAMVRVDENSNRIVTRGVTDDVETEITSVPGEIKNLVWKRSGKSLFYSAESDDFVQIYKKQLDSSPPVQITFDASDSLVQDFSEIQNSLLFTSSVESSDLWTVGVDGSNESALAAQISSELWPHSSPDGESVVYQNIRHLNRGTNLFDGSIVRQSLSNPDIITEITDRGYSPQWSGDGRHIGFLRYSEKNGTEIWAARSDGTQSRKLASGNIRMMGYSISPYNTTQQSIFAWSPDGAELAYSKKTDDVSNIWLVSADGSLKKKLTTNSNRDRRLVCPIWSPDGKRMAYASITKKRRGKPKYSYELWEYEFDKQAEKLVLQKGEKIRLIGWSASGTKLHFIRSQKDKNSQNPLLFEVVLYGVSIESGAETIANRLTDTYPYNIRLSPDRLKVGFVSRQSEKDNVWIANVGGGPPTKVTKNNDPKQFFSKLAWSADGKDIYFGRQSRFSLLSIIEMKGE